MLLWRTADYMRGAHFRNGSKHFVKMECMGLLESAAKLFRADLPSLFYSLVPALHTAYRALRQNKSYRQKKKQFPLTVIGGNRFYKIL